MGKLKNGKAASKDEVTGEMMKGGGFMDLDKVYDTVNWEAQWQVLRMYDVGGKFLSVIKSMYVNSLACKRVKGGESECFRIKIGVRQGCIMSPWLFSMYMDAVMKVGMGKMGVRFLEEEKECRLHDLLYTDYSVLWGKLEQDLKVMVKYFIEECMRRSEN